MSEAQNSSREDTNLANRDHVVLTRGVFRPRQTRQLPRAVDLNGAASKLSKLLITTTPFHSLTQRYSMNVDGNFN